MAGFTAAAIERFVRHGVPPGKPHASLRDGTGLVLRLMPSGKASWQFVYRLRGLGRAGTQKTVTIGAWPAIGAYVAAEESRRLAGEVARRRDPRAEIVMEKRRRQTTVNAALDDYQKWIISRGLVAAKPAMSSLRRGLSHLSSHELKALDRVTCIEAIERIARSGRPGAAKDFRKHLRSFINRALTLGVIVIDPLAGHRLPARTKGDVLEAEQHGKALSEDEIVAVWRAASAIGVPFGALVKMALLSGLRRNELASMRWSWVDRKASRITIPGEVMKNGREHAVPITDLVGRLLDATPTRGGDLVFPSEHRLGGGTPLSGWSHLVPRLRRESGVIGVALHDFRRTFRSALADLNVREEIAEAMIAHRRSDLVARYNRAGLWDLRREAAAKYDAWLASVVERVEGDTAANVVPLAPVKRA